MARIIQDNIPTLMEQDGKTVNVRKAESSKEFFALLQEKMISDILAIPQEKTAVGKARRIADIDIALQEFVPSIVGALHKTYVEILSERQGKVGAYSQRLVAENSDVNRAPDTDNPILKYGMKNNWPELPLRNNENGKPYLTLPSGESNWLVAMQDIEVQKMILVYVSNQEQS
jgi:predicted house-cleaning noncanonical NTP pyrophosphatase (MazG superfamily)